jgi:hypothetical protein
LAATLGWLKGASENFFGGFLASETVLHSHEILELINRLLSQLHG